MSNASEEVALAGQVVVPEPFVKGRPRRYEVALEGLDTHVMITLHTTKYFPLSKGDMINGIVRRVPSLRKNRVTGEDVDEYLFLYPPRVEIPLLPTSVEKYCYFATKDNGAKFKMYANITKSAGGEENIVDFVHDWASRYALHRSPEILAEVENIEAFQAKAFLNLWYRDNLDRQLILMDIDNDARDAYPYTILEMIRQLQDNPYAVPQITLRKAQELQESTPEKMLCGEIVRWLWNDHFSFGHSYIDENRLLSAFSSITPSIATLLMKEYRIVAKGGKIYFDYAYAAEQVIIENVKRLAPLSFPPLDLQFEAHLSLEQRKAVELVTGKGISILTGGPGTGKCLAPYEEVALYHGDYRKGLLREKKRADQVCVGDVLCGMYGTPRVVTAIGSGEGPLYRVSALDTSLSFVCNDEHILTVFYQDEIVDVPLLDCPQDALLLVRKNQGFSTHPFEVVEAGYGPFSGFEVDGDGRYLLANGIVTHNTTILRTIIQNYDRVQRPYELVSFTGKAVAHANEVLQKIVARTIHRNLGSLKRTQYAIIIEEASMVASHLLAKLLEHHVAAQIIFVGDIDQLTPLSWGSPMLQLLRSRRVPVVTLTANYRQGSDSANGIVINTTLLRQGKDFNWVSTSNFNILKGDLSTVLETISFLHGNGISHDRFTVLTPYTSKHVNVYSEITKHVQRLYFPTDPLCKVKDSNGRFFYLGDRVMLTKNITELNIFNGMEGKVTAFRPDCIEVDFGLLNGRHNFSLQVKKEFGEEATKDITVGILVHAYCLSIDKSQGSEYDVVIFYIPYEAIPTSFLNKNRTYVALSRGKKHVIFVGNIDTFTASARRKAPYRRNNLIEPLESLPVVDKEDFVMEECSDEAEENPVDEYFEFD